MTTTIYQLLRTSPLERLATRALLSAVTGFNAAQVISHSEYQLTAAELAKYNDYLQRAQTGEPLAYILGCKEFYSREYLVTPATLIPRPETELLVEQALATISPTATVLELGTGSGCIAITLKLECPSLSVTATDISAEALKVAHGNAARLGAAINWVQSDWFQAITARYDLIISNPPYIRFGDPHLPELRYEPLTALTDFNDGLSHYRQIIAQAPQYLTANGWLMLEHGYDQGTALQALMQQARFNAITTLRDLADTERITLGQS